MRFHLGEDLANPGCDGNRPSHGQNVTDNTMAFLEGFANTLDCQTHIIILAAGSLCASILRPHSQNGHHIRRMDTIDGYMRAFPDFLFSPHLSVFTT